MITKKDFLRKLSAETGYTQKDIEAVLNGVRTVLVDVAKNLDKVRLFDGVTVEGREVPERAGRNPQTGEEITIPAKTRMVFKVGTTVKRDINE